MEAKEKNSNEAKRRITIFSNGSKLNGKVLLYSNSDLWQDFLSRCGKKLNLPSPSRAFTVQGSEINDVVEVISGEILFISSGEHFLSPTGTL